MPTVKPLHSMSIDQHPKFKNLPLSNDNILLLLNNKYDQTEIARFYGISKQAINARMKRLGISKNQVTLSNILIDVEDKKKEAIEDLKSILDNEHEKVTRVADKALNKLDVMLDHVKDDDVKAIVPVTAVRDRTFTQRRTLEDKSTGEIDYKTLNLNLTQITQEIKQYKLDNNMGDIEAEVVE